MQFPELKGLEIADSPFKKSGPVDTHGRGKRTRSVEVGRPTKRMRSDSHKAKKVLYPKDN